jgi:hypothetical protein
MERAVTSGAYVPDEDDDAETRVECSLCAHLIPPDEVEDLYCSGCGAHICSRHHGEPPFGQHSQEEHASDEDDDEAAEDPLADHDL